MSCCSSLSSTRAALIRAMDARTAIHRSNDGPHANLVMKCLLQTIVQAQDLM